MTTFQNQSLDMNSCDHYVHRSNAWKSLQKQKGDIVMCIYEKKNGQNTDA